MALFNHKISLADILREIPEESLTRISRKTKVDYCTKVLHGKLMFYLLIYGLLRVDSLSQRGLADAFSSPYSVPFLMWMQKKESLIAPFQSDCQ